MKWSGWVFALVMIVVLFVVRHSGEQHLRVEKSEADRLLAEKQAEVDTIFEKAGEGIPTLEQRLAEENAKKEKMAAERDSLNATLQELQAKVERFQAKTDQLKEERENAVSKREESIDEIREIQQNIARVEKQLQILREAIRSVTESGDMQ